MPHQSKNTLDHCYTTVKDAYRAVPRAALGLSDHVMVHLIPTYRQKLKLTKPSVSTTKRWTSEAVEELRTCLDTTDWDMFKGATHDLDEYTRTLDLIYPLLQIRKEKEAALKSGDRDCSREAKYRFSRELRESVYSEKLQQQFTANDSASVWRPEADHRLQASGSRGQSPPPPPLHSPSVPPPITHHHSPPPLLAPGPDGVSPSTLRHCAEELPPVFTDISNSTPPWSRARPVALTSVVMKSSERLILPHLKSITTPLLDPLQFAYRANRSVDDAVNLALHSILQHLDSPGTYARILLVDFSSAFNTIRPALLQDKLSQLSVPASLCRWITHFLTDQGQYVRLGKSLGLCLHQHWITPGLCPPPLLFSLYTNCCTSSPQSVKLIRFVEDTTLIGLVSNGNETAYRREVARLVSWCGHNTCS
ncbi:hypothetical protein D4764_15G0006040 [Takifugu flavidus]|uniref:Reverse transcriptase domain-containing protein n=1 Tax=Takifugu flavidus TaxID=433684 RepID=A0A5C6P4R2_9TELE|nr:hypothetical protein D4764_15G0006040 [Takifugu flavidus]